MIIDEPTPFKINKGPAPANRRERRNRARAAKLPLSVVNQAVPRRVPAKLGIKQFKRMGGGHLINEYKTHAWRAAHEQNERLKAARVRGETEVPDLPGGEGRAKFPAIRRAETPPQENTDQ